jgi:hypothetical protein
MTTKILKVLKTWMLPTLALAALMVAIVPKAHAANSDDAQRAFYDQLMVSRLNLGGANTQDCVNLSYVGTSTESLVTISATAMTFYAPFNVLDTGVGSSGVVTYSSTLGANTIDGLCAYLNGLNTSGPGGKSTYQCAKTNCKGDDVPGTMLKTQTETSGTNNLKAVGGFNVLITTNTTIQLGVQPAPGRRVVLYRVDSNINQADTTHVYGQLRKYGAGKDRFGVAVNDTTEVWKSPAQTTNATSNWPNNLAFLQPWLEFATDAHVVIVGGSAAGNDQVNAANTSANFIQAVWAER